MISKKKQSQINKYVGREDPTSTSEVVTSQAGRHHGRRRSLLTPESRASTFLLKIFLDAYALRNPKTIPTSQK
jgi:hypothetical protein